MHNILVQYRSNIIEMKNYCSQQFTNIFIDHPIPPNIIEIIFEHTNAGDNLEEAIESCIELINNND